MARKRPDPTPTEPRAFRSAVEIEAGISKLQRRIHELEELNVVAAVLEGTSADHVAESNVRASIREVFGSNSPEFEEHQHIRLWAGVLRVNMDPQEVIEAKDRGRRQVIGVLKGLIGRLNEKKEDLSGGTLVAPSSDFDRLNLHPRIREVSRDLFIDGHRWEAVFAAAKALVNYVKERSGRHDLDGAALVRTVFSKNGPALAFNELSNQTDMDEQEGMMHLYEGAVLGIRNPGGHAFPEGPEQRAIEYLSFLSLLAHRLQEAQRKGRS